MERSRERERERNVYFIRQLPLSIQRAAEHFSLTTLTRIIYAFDPFSFFIDTYLALRRSGGGGGGGEESPSTCGYDITISGIVHNVRSYVRRSLARRIKE